VERLGYYRRARMLHQAAQLVVRNSLAVCPQREQLRQLPGIGAYTAAAIASIAHGEPWPWWTATWSGCCADGGLGRRQPRRSSSPQAQNRGFCRPDLDPKRPGDLTRRSWIWERQSAAAQSAMPDMPLRKDCAPAASTKHCPGADDQPRDCPRAFSAHWPQAN